MSFTTTTQNTLKIHELPEAYKFYTLEIRSDEKSTYLVDGETKNNILRSKGNFIELGSGEVINKAYIISISLNIDKTRNLFFALPDIERTHLLNKQNIPATNIR